MLIPIAILTRDSASDPPIESQIAVNPHSLARVEQYDDGIVQWWADGMTGPKISPGTVAEFAAMVNEWCLMDDEGEGEECKSENSDTE